MTTMIDDMNHVLVEVKDFLSAHSLPGSVRSLNYTKDTDVYDIQIDVDGNVDLTDWARMTNDRTTAPKNLRHLRLTRVNPQSYAGALVLPETWLTDSENTAMRQEQEFQVILPMDPRSALQAKRID
jgi:hypothetical protein